MIIAFPSYTCSYLLSKEDYFSGFIGHKIRLRNRAGERRQHIIPMVIGVHVVEIGDLALADVVILADEIAVWAAR